MSSNLVIFDFDGTIVDSEPNHQQAKWVLFKKLGIDVSQEMMNSLTGMSGYDGLKKIKEAYGVQLSVDQMVSRFMELYNQLAYANTVVFPSIKILLEQLKEQEVPMVIASSGTPDYLNGLTEHLKIKHYFKAIYSAVQVQHGKPAPDLFLYAARQMGYQPSRCVVFEDSEAGVIAAREAAMPCIAMPMTEQYHLPIFNQYPLLTFKTAYQLEVAKVMTLIK